MPDRSENAVGIAAGYDITGDGEVKELVRAWLAPNDDDAFLVTWDENSVTPTLLTEYLDPDRDPTTNAVEDLVALAGTDGYVDNDDFDNDLYLWFDRDTDGPRHRTRWRP